MALHRSLAHPFSTKSPVWFASSLALSLAVAGVGGAQISQAAIIDPSGAPNNFAANTCADRTFRAMSVPQRVGQLFMGSVTPSAPDSTRIDLMRKYHVGSVFLAGRSSAGTTATNTLVQGLQAKADSAAGHRVGLLVSTDQEGGQVQVLSGPGFSTIPSALTQGSWTTSKLRGEAAVWAKELKAAGVNLNLAPVADVVPESLGRANAPIGRYDREFGYTAATVAPHSDAFLAGSAQSGVLATLKHFPGLGNVRDNTDTTADVVDTVTTRESSSITTFASGIKAGAPFVMISSATYSKIDPNHRAAFSSTVVQGLLRKTLGFKGVVVSDDLGNAVAVKAVPAGDRAVKFLSAGGDLVLTVEPNLIPAMTKAVQSRMTQSATFRVQVDASVHRVLNAKQKAGLLSCG
ncbi:glycoside hydrolase family 3 N-terminal domain-containing protein [Streptomyces sp. 142MFCol3.1]|uniref:glycoside hydrolase family 3 N-terminal domain-containing protein n=1 Tax=Streptomyces sp. 142MFCol3.1 TaxID=1172179 RepID=UPI0003FBB275|nr:glycoside hydrolase family 3 N-terminal domain-containing protein [Streptomyces sp. 142MFCol3.1]